MRYLSAMISLGIQHKLLVIQVIFTVPALKEHKPGGDLTSIRLDYGRMKTQVVVQKSSRIPLWDGDPAKAGEPRPQVYTSQTGLRRSTRRC